MQPLFISTTLPANIEYKTCKLVKLDFKWSHSRDDSKEP